MDKGLPSMLSLPLFNQPKVPNNQTSPSSEARGKFWKGIKVGSAHVPSFPDLGITLLKCLVTENRISGFWAALIMIMVLIGQVNLVAQPAYVQTLKSFGLADGVSSYAALLQGEDGVFYGTTIGGGGAESGTVFKLMPDGSGFAVLHHFKYSDGYGPYSTLIKGSDGALYGTTCNGTIFKLKADGSGFAVLHYFSDVDGASPYAGLIKGSDGALYGTTYRGGSSGDGTVFKINEDGSGFAVIHNFDYTEGANPYASLLKGADGALYGTTYYGGSSRYGTVFKLNEDGSEFQVLHNFDIDSYFNGARPAAGLIKGSDGALYGTTDFGGGGAGTVFKINEDGSGFAVIHHFLFRDGETPYSSLIKGSDGALYGTTVYGGSSGQGTVFRLNEDGSGFAVIHHFTGLDGSSPHANLVKGLDGALYGTARAGGSSGQGTVFRLNEDGSGFAVTHNFVFAGGEVANPQSSLIRGSDGAFYGTSARGGTYDKGTVYRVEEDGGGYKILHHFAYTNGANPSGNLIKGLDGALYGTTCIGGNPGAGTVFKLNEDGSGFAVIHHFNVADGMNLYASVLQGADGLLYGTAYYGGSLGYGTVFRLRTDGSDFAVLHDFTGADGANPFANLAQGADGALYGTTYYGGNASLGTVFKLKTDGSEFTVLHHFGNYPDAAYPFAGLIKGSDGALYGATMYGGRLGRGTVFKLNEDGSDFALIHQFGDNDGNPAASLIKGSDGALYGTTRYGGSAWLGNIFKLNEDGSGYSVLHEFNYPYGVHPGSALLETHPGVFFGTTSEGGDQGLGTLYSLAFNSAPIADAGGPYSTSEGSSVIVTGSATDREGGPLTYEWDLDNDGTFETPGQSVTFSAANLDGPSSCTIKLKVTDSGERSNVASTVVNVQNIAPTLTGITGPTAPVARTPSGASVAISALFTDPGLADTHTAIFAWGDGDTSSESITAGSVTGAHTYAATGVYSVQVTITDDDGGTTTQTFQQVVVYSPDEGFVTGGGWMTSPAGAYKADPTLSGKVTFGFTAKYLKGAAVPVGNTQFHFQLADFKFESAAYQWLVIAGAKAEYKGTGTINGAGNYGFMLTAIDGQAISGVGVDRFRIKIWDTATGATIYDNVQTTAANLASADIQAIAGGSIALHKD